MLIIDDREILEHPDIPKGLTIPYTIQRLDCADYAFLDRSNNAVGIERAMIADLVGKLRSGRLEEQLSRCSYAYKTTILMVEGIWDAGESGGMLTLYRYGGCFHTNKGVNGYHPNHTYPTTRYNDLVALLVRLSELGVELIQTPTLQCSLEAISTIYIQRTKPEESHTLFKKIRQLQMPVKLSDNPAIPKLLALCPRLSEKTAIELIAKYDSIWGVLNAPDKELQEVHGFGKVLAQRLKESVGVTK